MDMNEIATLLHIEEKTRGQPKLKSIWDEAVRVLEAHAADVTASKQPEETEVADDGVHTEETRQQDDLRRD